MIVPVHLWDDGRSSGWSDIIVVSKGFGYLNEMRKYCSEQWFKERYDVRIFTTLCWGRHHLLGNVGGMGMKVWVVLRLHGMKENFSRLLTSLSAMAAYCRLAFLCSSRVAAFNLTLIFDIYRHWA